MWISFGFISVSRSYFGFEVDFWIVFWSKVTRKVYANFVGVRNRFLQWKIVSFLWYMYFEKVSLRMFLADSVSRDSCIRHLPTYTYICFYNFVKNTVLCKIESRVSEIVQNNYTAEILFREFHIVLHFFLNFHSCVNTIGMDSGNLCHALSLGKHGH